MFSRTGPEGKVPETPARRAESVNPIFLFKKSVQEDQRVDVGVYPPSPLAKDSLHHLQVFTVWSVAALTISSLASSGENTGT